MKRTIVFILFLTLISACATPLAKINGDAPTATLVLLVEPPDAKVFLDGKYIGRAHRFTAEKGGLPLTAGAHRLRLEADDFLNELIVVTAQTRNEPIKVRMLPKPEPTPEPEE